MLLVSSLLTHYLFNKASNFSASAMIPLLSMVWRLKLFRKPDRLSVTLSFKLASVTLASRASTSLSLASTFSVST